MKRVKGLYALSDKFFDDLYATNERREIDRLVDIYAPLQSPKDLEQTPEILEECEILFSGWGGPHFSEKLLANAPNLKLILHAGGTVRAHVSQALWDRGIPLCSAYAANAQPVVEYTLGAILFSLKHGWRYSNEIKKQGRYPKHWRVPGACGSGVGLVSMGMIARMLREKLRPFDLEVVTFDPYLTEGDADRLGVNLVSLKELFSVSDVVSLHSPELSETIGMIGGDLISRMKQGATLINTARGSLIREDELIEVVSRRPDLQILLDVTSPEPPVAGSKLYTLPNVILTPHIAGALGNECQRLGRSMVEELQRFVKGDSLKWIITPELARNSSHRPNFIDERKPVKPTVVYAT